MVTGVAGYFINPILCRSLFTGLVVMRYRERVFVGLCAMCNLVFLKIFISILICGLEYMKVTHLRSAGSVLCVFFGLFIRLISCSIIVWGYPFSVAICLIVLFSFSILSLVKGRLSARCMMYL